MAHVFISYAREDGAYARSLASSLRAGGVAVWFDATIDTGGRSKARRRRFGAARRSDSDFAGDQFDSLVAPPGDQFDDPVPPPGGRAARLDLARSIALQIHGLPEPPIDDPGELTDAFVRVRAAGLPEVTVRAGWAIPLSGRRRAGCVYVAAVHRGEETTSGLAALNGRRWLAAEFAADEIAQALGPAAATATADLIGS